MFLTPGRSSSIDSDRPSITRAVTLMFRSFTPRDAIAARTSPSISLLNGHAGVVSSSVNATFPSLIDRRSEQHTSELQSRQYLVCRLLLEKKNSASSHHCPF